MKKIAAVSLSLAAFGLATSAHAQSSVTLYGLIDAGFGYVKTNVGNRYAMMNGNLNGDRWGLKGREDLGGGLAAIFQLENGFNVGTGALGQGSREFGRQAIVGLTSDTYGTVKVGRGYDPVVDMVQGLTAEAILGSAAATAGDVDNNDNSARIQNQIKYISPMMAGLQFEAMYALGGITGSPGQAGTYSAAVAYTGGPLSLAGGYFHASNTNAATIGGKRTTWSGTTDSLFDGVVSNGYQTASGFGIAQVAGKYKFGNLSVGAGYSNVQFKSDAQSTFVSTEKFNTGRAFVQYQFTPVASGLIGYSFTKATGDTSATYHQVSFGGTYALSKRTDFYTVLAYQHASGTQRTTSGGTQKAVASIGSYGISGTDTQTMVLLGIRHRF